MLRLPKNYFFLPVFGAASLIIYFCFIDENRPVTTTKIEVGHPPPSTSAAQRRLGQNTDKKNAPDRIIFASPFGAASPVVYDESTPVREKTTLDQDMPPQRNEQNWPKHSNQ